MLWLLWRCEVLMNQLDSLLLGLYTHHTLLTRETIRKAIRHSYLEDLTGYFFYLS